jgi:hypothetical protein
MVVAFTTVNEASWLSNSTRFTGGLLKFVPVIVTVVPTGPLVGVNEAIVGVSAQAGATPTRPTSMAVSNETVNSLIACLRIGPIPPSFGPIL